MTLLWPFSLVPAGICALALVWFRDNNGEDDWRRVIDRRISAALRPGGAAGGGPSLALVALVIVLVALASPSIRVDADTAYVSNDGVVVLADISKSMTLDDIRPDRLSAARAAASAISAQAGARPVALIAYSGDAYLVEPFAVDRRQFGSMVGNLQYGLIPQEGSDVTRAMALAASVIEQSGMRNTRIVILTDGGGFDPASVDAARRLAARNHRVDVVRFSTPDAAERSTPDSQSIAQAADAGQGELIEAASDGNVDIASLEIATPLLSGGGISQLTLHSTDWRNMSHFLLLLAIAPVLLLFRRARR